MASTRKAVGPSVGAAVEASVGTLDNAGTARNYAGTLRALVIELGADTPLADLASPLAGAEICSRFERRWGEREAATWNRNLDALRSTIRHWADQGWLEVDSAWGLRRRKRPPDRTPCCAITGASTPTGTTSGRRSAGPAGSRWRVRESALRARSA